MDISQKENFKIYENFNHVKEIWQNFEKEAELYVFQCFDWLSHWYFTIGINEGVLPQIVVIKDDSDEVQMILPLGIKKNGFLKCLVWLGGEITDYMGPLISKKRSTNNSSIEDVFNYFRNNSLHLDLILLEKQPALINDLKNPFVMEECRSYLFNSYSAILKNDWDTFYKEHAGSKSRSTDRRKDRRLRDKGDLRFVIAEEQDEIKRIVEVMIEQKTRRYLDTGANNLFKDKYYRDFYLLFGQNTGQSNIRIHISALLLDEEIIATHWGGIFKKRFYFLMPTYTEGELSRFSPGKLLTIELFKWCINNNIEIFDFTVGDEAYKEDWCDYELELFKYLEPLTFKGWLYQFYENISEYVRENDKLLSIAKRIKRFLRR